MCLKIFLVVICVICFVASLVNLYYANLGVKRAEKNLKEARKNLKEIND